MINKLDYNIALKKRTLGLANAPNYLLVSWALTLVFFIFYVYFSLFPLVSSTLPFFKISLPFFLVSNMKKKCNSLSGDEEHNFSEQPIKLRTQVSFFFSLFPGLQLRDLLI